MRDRRLRAGFRVELKPRATVELPVAETQALMDTYQLANLTSRDVELFVTSNYIDAAMRAELEKLIDLKSRIGKERSTIEALDKEAVATVDEAVQYAEESPWPEPM